MTASKEQRQRLLELIYDLLPDDEAAELRRQIDTNPEVARWYAEVQQTHRLLVEAARLDARHSIPTSGGFHERPNPGV